MRTFFISHGSPDLVLKEVAARRALTQLANLPRPAGLLTLSAHWAHSGTQVQLGSATQHSTLHDFYGFPPPLYERQWNAPGLPEHAHALEQALQQAGFEAQKDDQRPLDHGVWSPLSLPFPTADLPTLPVSLPEDLSPAQLWQLGQVLGDFARQHHLWLVTTGAITHNLRALAPEGTPTAPWVQQFDQWVHQVIERRHWESLQQWQQQAPFAQRNHPTPEHFLPLLVAAGAQPEGLDTWHMSYTYGNLSMRMLADPETAALLDDARQAD